jgi:hypothetical protein
MKNISIEEDVLQMMRTHMSQLPERLRRQYASIESRKIGYGGVRYISRNLGIDRKTIQFRCRELDGICATVPGSRQRKIGGGRKKNSGR